MPHPDMVDGDSCSERIFGRSDPLGKGETPSGALFFVKCGVLGLLIYIGNEGHPASSKRSVLSAFLLKGFF